jgi:hypothetical protein
VTRKLSGVFIAFFRAPLQRRSGFKIDQTSIDQRSFTQKRAVISVTGTISLIHCFIAVSPPAELGWVIASVARVQLSSGVLDVEWSRRSAALIRSFTASASTPASLSNDDMGVERSAMFVHHQK